LLQIHNELATASSIETPWQKYLIVEEKLRWEIQNACGRMEYNGGECFGYSHQWRSGRERGEKE
jgi:hypothetical protein